MLEYSFELQMEAADSSKTLITIYQTTRRHIPEGNILPMFYLISDWIISLRLLNVAATAEVIVQQMGWKHYHKL
jgi:hypothetical protein